jgi:hypothetical protein
MKRVSFIRFQVAAVVVAPTLAVVELTAVLMECQGAVQGEPGNPGTGHFP